MLCYNKHTCTAILTAIYRFTSGCRMVYKETFRKYDANGHILQDVFHVSNGVKALEADITY